METDCIHIDPRFIRKQESVRCKLVHQKQVVLQDIYASTNPAPVYKPASTKPTFPAKELDIGVIKRHENLKNGLNQELLDLQLHKESLESDSSQFNRDNFIAFCQPENRKLFVTITKDGLDAAVTLKRQGEFRRILYRVKKTPISTQIEDLQGKFKTKYKSFFGARRLSDVEINFSPYQYKYKFDNNDVFEVFFEDPDDGEKLCQEDEAAERFPTGIDGLSDEGALRLRLYMKWEARPLTGEVNIIVKKSDRLKAEQVLTGGPHRHDLVYRIKKRNYKGDLVQLECLFQIDQSSTAEAMPSQDDYVEIFVRILEINGIANQVELVRGPPLTMSLSEMRYKICHKICLSAIDSGDWDYNQPFTNERWAELIRSHHHFLPWKVEVTKVGAGYLSAHIKFKDLDKGERILHSIRKYWTAHFSKLEDSQQEGVPLQAYYVIRTYIPATLRWIYNEQIRKLDQEMRRDSNRPDSWVRVIDHPGRIIVVEGNLRESVEHCKKKLDEIIKGEVLDCSSAEMAQLLYGCGLEWANVQQRKNATTALISVDRANENIYLYGAPRYVSSIKEQLLLFVKEPHDFFVECSITIGLPHYLPIMVYVLDSNGEKLISQLLGGCEIGFVKPNVLTFKGTVPQYNQLKMMLDTTQYRVMKTYTESAVGLAAQERIIALSECPVCLTRPIEEKFRLSCSHVYCVQCFAWTVKVALNNRELPLKCVIKGCEKPISLNCLMSLYFDDNSMKFKEYFLGRITPLKRAATYVGMTKGDLPFCIKPSCNGICTNDGYARRGPGPSTSQAVDLTAVKCSTCHTARCFKCPNPPHENRTCKEEAELRKNDPFSLEYYLKGKKGKFKRCPTTTCQAYISKKGNECNHITCAACKRHFCWVCLFSADTSQPIYKHMRGVHGTIGGRYGHLDHNLNGNLD